MERLLVPEQPVHGALGSRGNHSERLGLVLRKANTFFLVKWFSNEKQGKRPSQYGDQAWQNQTAEGGQSV